ncbi:hypothetical protein CI109_103503 [Kwoniella shandongensis]|uniref:Uncharacterized protein n=1 Tax=Kwoniella shandongensis TaxID=1734106 RepID=A0A5M6BXZ0_9TREE|nr:uncharacterized protein CI109_004595 [Kwoniella shandongensis]KAA5527060.1 hypothetical protein CI109_004595 [Kwoniella shandongensis]
MAPTIRRSASSSVPLLLSITKLAKLVPRSSSEWTTLAKSPVLDPEDPPDSPVFWWKLGLSVVLVLAGGVFAGLTLALMGSDELNLRVLSTSSEDPKERNSANKVLRLLARGRHWVLVVLLLGNVIVNESLPIFLDDVLGGGVKAVIVSTTMIVIFGEIIPQAVCVRYGLAIGGVCAPLVWGLMIFFSPIAYPIAKLLDYVLGAEEGHTYKKAELKSFLQFHREGEEPLRDDEIGILNGVLSLNEKHAQEIMTPIKDCLILPADKILDHDAIDQILLSGFSRIPVHEPGQKDNFIGMLLVKRLITYNPDDEWPVSKFSLLPLPEAKPEINCFQALDYFQTGRAHLLLISETPGQKGGALGIVSLEDLIEEIIGEEIVDETDRYEDNHSKKAVKRSGTAAVMRGIIERRRVINAFSRQPSRSGSMAQHPGGPNGTNAPTPATGGPAEGILVQIDNGNLIAEPVGFADESETSVNADPSRRLVIGTVSNGENGGMSPIAEISPVEGVAAQIDEEADNKQDAAVSGEGDASGEGEGEGDKTKSSGNMHSRDERQSKASKTKKTRTKKGVSRQKGRVRPIGTDAFEDHEEFEKACKALIEKYEKVEEGELGAGRTNRGWEWKEHKWSPHQGYLYRKVTRHLDQPQPVPTSAQDLPTQGDEDEEDEGAGLEEIEDESVALLRPLPSDSADSRGKKTRVDIEQSIVFSRTYRVPMFCFRAWDETGAPLSVISLLKLNVLHPPSPAPSTTSPFQSQSNSTPSDTLLQDPSSPFPLLTSTEHPTTGELVFSIHPCKVSAAVDEIVHAEGRTEENGADEELAHLGWLESWMMLTNGVVDLTWP